MKYEKYPNVHIFPLWSIWGKSRQVVWSKKFRGKNMTENKKFKTSTYKLLGSGCGSERPLSPWPAFCVGDGGSRRWNINGVRFCVRYNMAYSWYQASRWENGGWEGDGIQGIPGANGITSISNTRQSYCSARRHSGIWSLVSQWSEPLSQAIRTMSMVPCWKFIYFGRAGKWMALATNWVLSLKHG